MVDIHDRMPVFLTDENGEGRLTPKTEYLQSLLQPYDASISLDISPSPSCYVLSRR
ncbi:hypothetical protein G3M81_20460 [Bacillus paralicheniformis]|nr:hypothetical protein G3M81_20460 [Bacillus paralicheniformis]